MNMKPVKIMLCFGPAMQHTAQSLGNALSQRGYQVSLFTDGQSALKAHQKTRHALSVIDIDLPRLDGFNLCDRIITQFPDDKVVFLTDQHNKEDITQGFRLGAVDFIKAELETEEITLRLERLMAYTGIIQQEQQNVFHVGRYRLHSITQTITDTADNTSITITSRESELLKLLIMNVGQVVERQWVLKTFWNNDSYYNARSMDVYVSHLRHYLSGDPSISIVNKRGIGYSLIID